MTRLLLGLLVTWLGLVSSAHAAPNVLVLIADDLGSHALGYRGNSAIATPHLDQLAQQGMVFTRATCAHPLCVPSRAEMITGCTGFRNGVTYGQGLNRDLELWPETMRRAGYRTFHVGKWHYGGRPSQLGYDEAPGLFASGKPTDSQLAVDHRGAKVTGYVGWRFQTDDKTFEVDTPSGLTPGIDTSFADAAIEVIRRPSEKPYFMQVNFTAPHDPRLFPPGSEQRFKPEHLSLPRNFLPEHPFDHGNLRGRDELLLVFPRTEADIRRELAAYYAVVEHLDAQVGRILAALDASGQADETLVISTSDHGLALGSHGLIGKQNMYEHTINVPLIIRGPKVSAGSMTTAQCYLRDLYPTVCDWAGIEVPKTVTAKSLLPVLKNPAVEIHPFIVGYFANSQRMIRQDGWKYIWYPLAQREQLFDLARDPDEMHDLSQNATHGEKRGQLREKLFRWLKAEGDTQSGRNTNNR